MVTSCPAPRSSHAAASPASPAPRMTTRFPLVWRASTLCGNAQLKSEERDSPPTANPESFTNSRRLTFISPAILSCLYFSRNLQGRKFPKNPLSPAKRFDLPWLHEPDWSECFLLHIFQFGGLDPGIFHCAAALVLHMNVAELQIFDVMAGDAGDDRGLPRCTVGYDYIADDYAPQPAYGSALGTAHAAAQPEK